MTCLRLNRVLTLMNIFFAFAMNEGEAKMPIPAKTVRTKQTVTLHVVWMSLGRCSGAI